MNLREILESGRTIAVLGAHKDPFRPAHYVPRYLWEAGYRILPVNPRFAGEVLFGEVVRASLFELVEVYPGEPVDILNVFRRSQALPSHLEEILALRPRLVWLQLGIVHPEVEAKLKEANIPVVADRCLMVEHRQLFRGGTPL